MSRLWEPSAPGVRRNRSGPTVVLDPLKKHWRRDGDRLDLFLSREPDVQDHPPGLPSPLMTEKALLPLAVAHLSANADSLQLSTETG